MLITSKKEFNVPVATLPSTALLVKDSEYKVLNLNLKNDSNRSVSVSIQKFDGATWNTIVALQNLVPGGQSVLNGAMGMGMYRVYIALSNLAETDAPAGLIYGAMVIPLEQSDIVMGKEAGCDVTCQVTCQISCETNCQTTCEGACQSGCEFTQET